MVTQIGMPQGAEWLILLGIVVLLFGSTRLPQLVRSLGKSKKAWEEEIGSAKKSAELEESPVQQPVAQQPVAQQPVQQPAQQPVQQPPVQQPQTPPINGTAPGDSSSQN